MYTYTHTYFISNKRLPIVFFFFFIRSYYCSSKNVLDRSVIIRKQYYFPVRLDVRSEFTPSVHVWLFRLRYCFPAAGPEKRIESAHCVSRINHLKPGPYIVWSKQYYCVLRMERGRRIENHVFEWRMLVFEISL
jgi:hypothetical protein